MARRRARFVRPAPRTKMWIGAGVGLSTLAASTKVVIGSLSAGAKLLRPFTILRTRMELYYASDQISASEIPFGSYGMIVVTDAASAIGATAIPNPSAIDGAPEADWYVWQAVSHEIRRATDVGFSFGVGSRYVIDSRAMRKVTIDEDVVTMFDQQNAFGARLIDNGRQLIQLH